MLNAWWKILTATLLCIVNLSMVIVNLTLATICFLNSCHPALVGRDTPTGIFQLDHVATKQPGYGGDVLVFKESRHYAWAIHRVWLLVPAPHRLLTLTKGTSAQRWITMGCINVMPDVYAKLAACCSASKLKVEF